MIYACLEPRDPGLLLNTWEMSGEKRSQNHRISGILLFCFFGSGFLGLVYEIIWIRKLGLIFGTLIGAIFLAIALFSPPLSPEARPCQNDRFIPT